MVSIQNESGRIFSEGKGTRVDASGSQLAQGHVLLSLMPELMHPVLYYLEGRTF